MFSLIFEQINIFSILFYLDWNVDVFDRQITRIYRSLREIKCVTPIKCTYQSTSKVNCMVKLKRNKLKFAYERTVRKL